MCYPLVSFPDSPESVIYCSCYPQSPRSPIAFSFFIGTEQGDAVQPGDEILQLAGTAVQGLTRFEAWNVIKALPDGPVTVVIRRNGLEGKQTTASADS